jgi:hypothetical protein
MGRLSRAEQRLDVARNSLNSEIRQLVRRGVPEFTVTVRDSDWGRLDRILPGIVDQIQLHGHSVLGINHEPWSGMASINIRSCAPAAVRDAQVGSSALSMSKDQLDEVWCWMEYEFHKRTMEAAWNIYLRRLGLGYALPDGLPQKTRFWLNAYPALCASLLGKEALPEPDLAVACADECQQTAERSDESQLRASTTVRELLS